MSEVSQNSESSRERSNANLKPFEPGKSGNPGGRPKKRLIDELLTELLEVADSKDARAVAKALIKKASKGDSLAAKLIAERTQGKPTQKVEVTGADGGPMEASIAIKFV